MARPEAPVDRTVPARAALADFLRARRAAAGLTYREMSRRMHGMPSKTTFERAASGACDPTLKTVETYVELTMTKEEEFIGGLGAVTDQARKLWIKARRATRSPYYLHKAPDPALISNRADFSRALRDQHVWAGFPSPGEMERTAGPGELPSSTTRRIIQGRSLPVTPGQTIAFLKACYVDTHGLEPWLQAGERVFGQDGIDVSVSPPGSRRCPQYAASPSRSVLRQSLLVD
ncbi:helix-turn-helix domain-containing protein [Streptomyces sp. NPDC003757]